jgi:hypothetical protein
MLAGDRGAPRMPRVSEKLASMARAVGLEIEVKPERLYGKLTGRIAWALVDLSEFRRPKKSGTVRKPESLPYFMGVALEQLTREKSAALAACMAAHPAGRAL